MSERGQWAFVSVGVVVATVMVVAFFGSQNQSALESFSATVEQQLNVLQESVQKVNARNSEIVDMLGQQRGKHAQVNSGLQPAMGASTKGEAGTDQACQGDPSDCVPYKASSGKTPPVLKGLAKLDGRTSVMQRLFQGFADAGFAIFAKESNTLGCRGECIEYGFLRLNLNPSNQIRLGPSQYPSTSLTESFGFFDNDDAEWARKKVVHNAQMARQVKARRYKQGHVFFQDNWEPSWHCAYMQRVGNQGEGGKWLCDPYKIAGNKDCKVISIGSHNQFDFEESILELNPHCEIHTFDHTVKNPSNKPAAVNFHPYGLGAVDEPPIFSLPTLMEKAGLKPDTVIEIFKIDCEGCEFKVWKEIASGPIRQVLMEIHWFKAA